MKKTNVMRILEQTHLPYNLLTYEAKDGAIDGISVAKKISRPHEVVFKTLVLQGASKNFYVCMIPVAQQLSLKKVALLVKEKKLEMIATKDLLKVTGYIRGGCSPIGMKKSYDMLIDENVIKMDQIIFSAGKIGMQIEMAVNDLLKIIKPDIKDICD